MEGISAAGHAYADVAVVSGEPHVRRSELKECEEIDLQNVQPHWECHVPKVCNTKCLTHAYPIAKSVLSRISFISYYWY